MLWKIFCVILVCFSCASCRKDYSGYKLIRVIPYHDNELERLYEFMNDPTMDLDFWKMPAKGQSVDIMVAEKDFYQLIARLNSHRMTWDVVVPDIQKLITEEMHSMNPHHRGKRDVPDLRDEFVDSIDNNQTENSYDSSFKNNYRRHSDINKWLNVMVNECSDSESCSTFILGTTANERSIKGIKISKNVNNDEEKTRPAVLIDCGIHAREWISVATCVFFVDRLIKSNDAQVRKWKDVYDFYVIPLLNPDGYEFSHTDSRLWRKNRSVQKGSLWSCTGVDLNRNFGFHWMERGASSYCSSAIYGGPKAFSENESKALRDFLIPNTRNVQVYLTFHSYGQYWLVPWGYNYNVYPSDFNDLKSAAMAGAEALKKVHGTKYSVGNTADMLYAAAGGSDDWAKGSAGIKYSYTLELRPSSGSFHYGFILPAKYILPVGEETLAGMFGLLQHINGRK